jgi:predicted DNA-binding protein
MGRREDALKALNDRDWSGAEVEHNPRPAMTVQSIRLPEHLQQWLEGEANRLGTNPSAVIRGLVERAARPADVGEMVTVRADKLRQKVQQAVEQVISDAA